jgi:adenylate kinase
MIIVLLGPPGSGKGTIAKIIEDIYGIPVITTGDLLRKAIADGTWIGKGARTFMEKGELVPDELVNEIVSERLLKSDAQKGFVLDGFPRSLNQAKALDEILSKIDKRIDHVIHVDVEDEVIVNRLNNRLTCPKCGAIYNLQNKPPREDMKCDICGTLLILRLDDRPEVTRNRLRIYREKTQPLLTWYEDKGKVERIRGDIKLAKLPEAVKKLLEK